MEWDEKEYIITVWVILWIWYKDKWMQEVYVYEYEKY